MLLNADLKQIEVCVFAQLSKPKLLIQLLNEGKDIHRFIGSRIYGKEAEEITDTERSDIKSSTFGIIYGNGPKTLSERTGRSFEWCQDFIKEFYNLFPEAKEWHTEIIKRVEATGQLKLFTGFTLKFKKYPAKFEWQRQKGIIESYNPPDIKNHPVQHTAWILNSLILGNFYREKAIFNRDKYLLINTVHDSIMLDCKDEYINECIEDIVNIVDRLPNIVYNIWKERLIIPIKIDISIGNNWLEL